MEKGLFKTFIWSLQQDKFNFSWCKITKLENHSQRYIYEVLYNWSTQNYVINKVVKPLHLKKD